jgi:hypothetical protein
MKTLQRTGVKYSQHDAEYQNELTDLLTREFGEPLDDFEREVYGIGNRKLFLGSEYHNNMNCSDIAKAIIRVHRRINRTAALEYLRCNYYRYVNIDKAFADKFVLAGIRAKK